MSDVVSATVTWAGQGSPPLQMWYFNSQGSGDVAKIRCAVSSSRPPTHYSTVIYTSSVAAKLVALEFHFFDIFSLRNIRSQFIHPFCRV